MNYSPLIQSKMHIVQCPYVFLYGISSIIFVYAVMEVLFHYLLSSQLFLCTQVGVQRLVRYLERTNWRKRSHLFTT